MDQEIKNMNEKIKVFVITLEGSIDRQTSISSQLNKLGIPFEFIFGVDGRKLSDEQIKKLFDKKKNCIYYRKRNLKERGMTAAEIGCALSHRLAYEEIIKRNIKHAIILEDDIYFNEYFPLVIEHFSQLKLNNYLIKMDIEPSYIEILPWHKIRLDGNFEIIHPYINYNLWSTMGYYIDIKAAKTMFRLTKQIFCVADDYDFFKNFIKIRLFNKAVVFENSQLFQSIIGNRSQILNLDECVGIFSKIYQRIIHSRPMRKYNHVLTLFQ